MFLSFVKIFSIIIFIITIPIFITRIFYPNFFTQPISDMLIKAIQKIALENDLSDFKGYIIEYDKSKDKLFLVKDEEFSDIDVITPLIIKSRIIGIVTLILALCIELLPILLRIVGIISTRFLIIYYIIFVLIYVVTIILPTKLGYRISDFGKSVLLLVLLFTKLL